jgi:hypothetical protein
LPGKSAKVGQSAPDMAEEQDYMFKLDVKAESRLKAKKTPERVTHQAKASQEIAF